MARARSDVDDLVAEAAAAPVEGWDLSWLGGRAAEDGPPWGAGRGWAERLPRVSAGRAGQTGGGEVLAGVPSDPPRVVATEGWPPNVARATRLLHPRGVAVVAAPAEPPLPSG